MRRQALLPRACAIATIIALFAAAGWLAEVLSAPSPDEAPAILDAAMEAHGRGEFDDAMDLFDRAVEADPSYAAALLERARAHYGVNDLPAALRDYDRLLALDPGHIDARYARAKTLLGLRREAEMFGELDRVLAAEPDHVEARWFRAWMRSNSREHEAALRDLDALEQAGELPAGVTMEDLLAHRAEVRMGAGDDAGALADLERILSQDPANGEALRAAAWALWGLGRYDEAQSRLEQARLAQPASLHTRLALGVGMLHRGDAEAAAAELGALVNDARSAAPHEAHLFRWIALTESGALADAAASLPARDALPAWPGVLVEFLAGGMEEADLLDLAASEGDLHRRARYQCEAFYYAGVKRFLAEDQAAAADLLRQSIATNIRGYYEYQAALALLRRIETDSAN